MTWKEKLESCSAESLYDLADTMADRLDEFEEDNAELRRRASKAIDILDQAAGDSDPDIIDYDECPDIRAIHVLLGKEEE